MKLATSAKSDDHDHSVKIDTDKDEDEEEVTKLPHQLMCAKDIFPITRVLV